MINAIEHHPNFSKSYPRQTVRWEAILKITESFSVPAEIWDISCGGVFVRPKITAEPPIHVGDRIFVEFFMPGTNTKLLVAGSVRRVGINRAHQCAGWSIEFDERNQQIDSFIRGQKA